MQSQATIRRETAADIEAIADLTAAAFRTVAVSNQTEPFIIEALRGADALALSLVAEIEGNVVGHVAFSPVTISDGTRDWYGLGPVSVLPEYQRQGIGGALIRKGLSMLRGLGGQGCCLVGDPNYYRRFGFRTIPALVHEGVPPEVFLTLPLGEFVPAGVVTFHEGSRATGCDEAEGDADNCG